MKTLFSDSSSLRSTTTKPLSRPESLRGHHEDGPNQVVPSSGRFGLECTASREAGRASQPRVARTWRRVQGLQASSHGERMLERTRIAGGRHGVQAGHLRSMSVCRLHLLEVWKCLVRKVLIHIAGWARSLLLFSGQWTVDPMKSTQTLLQKWPSSTNEFRINVRNSDRADGTQLLDHVPRWAHGEEDEARR